MLLFLCFVFVLFFSKSILHVLEQQLYPFPLITMDNYRLYGETVRTPFVRNQYANLSVVEEWNSIWSGVRSFHSNDTMVLYKRAAPIDSIINRSVRICSPDTFLIMMTPVRKQDYSIRQLLRKIIPQGLVIQGKKINRVFIVSIMDNEREQIKEIRKEMEQYGDIIISRHEDAHSSIHLYVWDGYLWIRDHCHSAVFAGKFETDAVHFLGNLISLLLQYPTKRFYGGRTCGFALHAREQNTSISHLSAPFDYPEINTFRFISGTSNVLSMDVLDYLISGADYEPYFVCADDPMTGLILHRVGIEPTEMGTQSCPYHIVRYDCGGRYTNVSLLPDCLCCYDPIKKYEEYKETIDFLGDRIYKSTLQERVDMSKNYRRSCY